MSLNDLEKILQIKFKNKKILEKSLIHKSLDPINNNEKLEFLGDRVLGFVISKKLYEIYPEETEGALDKKFASLVNKNMCLSIANKLNLSKFIKTNTNKTNNYKPENKIISDTCEAIIGAIFLDQGIKVVENFILKIWNEYIENTQETKIDSKTMLQEFSLKKYKVLPKYTLLKTKGPKHKPVFHVQVKIKSSKSIDGIGSSKKLAEQDAATSLLRKMNLL
jgi:ribonuclease-3|tara:strand:+ start:1175 stop:1837 length:663 start_codon:yes stop_codon:yes gene_type:complete